MTQNELRRLAEQNISGFNGSGVSFYDGSDDPSLMFPDGINNFAEEDQSGLFYSFTLANVGSAAEARSLAIIPGYFTSASEIKDNAGSAVAAILKEGDVITTTDKVVTCKGKPKSYDEFLAFIKNNPARLLGMKMQVDDDSQLSEDITVRKISPFRSLQDRTISPSIFKNSSQNNSKLVEIPLQDEQLDNQTVMLYTLGAGRTVTFTFFIGAIRNVAGELDAKAKIARKNIGLNRQFS